MQSIREEVKKKYGRIARRITAKPGGCGCGGADCCAKAPSQSGFYTARELAELPREAVSASLGCANPVALADLQPGETVLDLGSGGGIDVLLSARLVGETGMAYGLDMTNSMLRLANRNKKNSGLKNVAFLKGYIEKIPLADETVDDITSNCGINLTEDKLAALKEAYRVIKPGGRLAIADIVQVKPVPPELKKNIALWVGCISGALTTEAYAEALAAAGFKLIEINPVLFYDRAAIDGMVTDAEIKKLYNNKDLDALDGAFASAHIKAVR